ncbi:MAG TPA: FkbM family methyltransferase, partial [Gemmatimonadales bacterium]|nr:FkbM family methyltransferase [Gemmatimonadales bacterium]
MRFTEALKHLTVHAGLYRPARRVIRRLRHADLVKFREHVAFYRRLPPGSLCFDVGANIGEVSEALLRAGHRVVAFEPNPDVLPELRARCDHHPAWRLLPVGVGSEAAVLPFYAAKASASSSFCPGWEQRELAGVHHVPVLPLELVIRSIGTPAYCKIDVEGFEEEVLAGLETPIALVSFEYHRDAPERAIGCL